MRKPTPGSVLNREDFWRRADAAKARDGRYPSWVFDFVSLHPSSFPGIPRLAGYSLLSPTCLIDQETGARPAFEALRFVTKAEGVREASRIAKQHGLFVVWCPDRSAQQRRAA